MKVLFYLFFLCGYFGNGSFTNENLLSGNLFGEILQNESGFQESQINITGSKYKGQIDSSTTTENAAPQLPNSAFAHEQIYSTTPIGYYSFIPCTIWIYNANMGAFACAQNNGNSPISVPQRQTIQNLENKIKELEKRIQTLENK